MLCPHCGRTLDDASDLAGQMVACPHCDGRFQVPVRGVLVDSPIIPAPQFQFPPQPQPVSIVVVEQPRQPAPARVRPVPYFSRAFSATSGILTACAAFLGLAVVAVVFLSVMLPDAPQSRSHAQLDEVRATAGKQYALRYLKQHGITELATDVSCFESEGRYWVAGNALDKFGGMHTFILTYNVGRFKDADRWELATAILDEEVLKY